MTAQGRVQVGGRAGQGEAARPPAALSALTWRSQAGALSPLLLPLSSWLGHLPAPLVPGVPLAPGAQA